MWLDDARQQHELCYRDPETGLEVRCVAVEYRDFPTVEWTLYFKNTGAQDTPIIADIQALDTSFQRLADDVYARFARPGEFVLHHHTGSICAANDYEPHATVLKPQEVTAAHVRRRPRQQRRVPLLQHPVARRGA